MVIERIELIANNEGISLFELERKIGASRGLFYKAKQGKNDIQSKWLSLIVENFPLYSAKWLLTGEGAMMATQDDSDTPITPPPVSPISKSTILVQLIDKLAEQAELIGNLSAEKRILDAEKRALEAEKRALEAELQLLREQTTMGLLSADGAFSSTAQIG